MHNFSLKQSGSAIFMALLVVAITVTLSVTWFMQTRMSVRRTQQMLISEQIYLYAQGVVDWAISALMLHNKTPQILPPTQIDNGIMMGRIDSYAVTSLSDSVSMKYAMSTRQNEYFLLKADARLGNQRLILYSLLHKQMINGKVKVGVIWQSRYIT